MLNAGEQGINMAAARDLAQGAGYIKEAINKVLAADADFIKGISGIPEVDIIGEVTEGELLLGATVPIGIKKSVRDKGVLSLVDSRHRNDI